MSAERAQILGLPHTGLLEALSRKKTDILYSQFLDAVVRMTDFQDPEGNIDKFYFLRQNRAKVVYFRHVSHADFGPLLILAKKLNKTGNLPVKGSLIVAKSLPTGDQSEMLSDFNRVAEPKLIAAGINPIYVTRKKDRDEYKLKVNSTELKNVMRAVQKGNNVIYSPEGTVEGGRLNPATGKPNGLNKVDDEIMATVLSREAETREIAFLPIVIQGTNDIYNPTTEKVAEGVKLEFVKQLVHHHPRKIATATVAEPFTSTDMIRLGVDLSNPEQFNTFLMNRFAERLPVEERGYYR